MDQLMEKRRAGVLCHLTSLPNRASRQPSFGTIGADAFQFVDFLAQHGFSVWQILPLGPTHPDLSPYLSLSAHAGNPQLIDLPWLCKKGWLEPSAIKNHSNFDNGQQLALIESAYDTFLQSENDQQHSAFRSFCQQNSYWLDDYALFITLRKHFAGLIWNEWPINFRDHEPESVAQFQTEHETELNAIRFQQFIFFSQWGELKEYANEKSILIVGDIPIFVAYDSAEVWSKRKYFSLDASGHAEFVAGVPPDYFSETGQRWGNPHYRWSEHQKDNFAWWRERIQTQSTLYDAVRIDHFRGLHEYWSIAADEPTAVNGHWVPAPGRALLQTLTQTFPHISFIAEDLGTITPEVTALRDEFSLPGMSILQFAFDGSPDNPYLPSNTSKNCLVYTATHDNDTTVAWFDALPDETKRFVYEVLPHQHEPMPWPMIHSVLESVADLAILPMQDILCLGAGNHMNFPGTTEDNWRWRFRWEQIDDAAVSKITSLISDTQRTQV